MIKHNLCPKTCFFFMWKSEFIGVQNGTFVVATYKKTDLCVIFFTKSAVLQVTLLKTGKWRICAQSVFRSQSWTITWVWIAVSTEMVYETMPQTKFCTKHKYVDDKPDEIWLRKYTLTKARSRFESRCQYNSMTTEQLKINLDQCYAFLVITGHHLWTKRA